MQARRRNICKYFSPRTHDKCSEEKWRKFSPQVPLSAPHFEGCAVVPSRKIEFRRAWLGCISRKSSSTRSVSHRALVAAGVKTLAADPTPVVGLLRPSRISALARGDCELPAGSASGKLLCRPGAYRLGIAAGAASYIMRASKSWRSGSCRRARIPGGMRRISSRAGQYSTCFGRPRRTAR